MPMDARVEIQGGAIRRLLYSVASMNCVVGWVGASGRVGRHV